LTPHKGIVEPWEALLTLAFFFVVVLTAYLVDRQEPIL
jgi:hypothetical protein